MPPIKPLSLKIVTWIEMIVIVVLAVVIVIYVQVLIQGHFQREAGDDNQEVLPQKEEKVIDSSLTTEEKERVLEQLSADSATSVPPEERAEMLDSLKVRSPETQITEDERLKILESLQISN